MSLNEKITSLENCLSYSLSESSIIIKNSCNEPVDIKAIEVEYYIYIQRSPSTRSAESIELGHLRKRVIERISVEEEIEPNASLSIYFGALRNIDNVYAIVGIDDKEYKIRLQKSS